MRRHLAYAAGAAALALAGCGGDDPTPQVADPTPTASVSASPSASAAVEKEAWEKKTDDGAVAFVEHWLEVFSTAFQTGEVRELQALHANSCSACAGFEQLISDAWDSGGSIEGAAWTASSLAPSQNPPDGKAAISVTVEQPKQVILESDGTKQQTPAGSADYLFELNWTGGEWQVANFTIATSETS
ncbi:DUF6318 family protein [Nocardioides sp. 31GB23]|uniref:DUF6318 family protein n=1 Tax=Nocardioides sp. 31GB23 TaxID=3156065 RepID=UPI0032AFF286